MIVKLAEDKGLKGKISADFVCNELDAVAVPNEGEDFKPITNDIEADQLLQ